MSYTGKSSLPLILLWAVPSWRIEREATERPPVLVCRLAVISGDVCAETRRPSHRMVWSVRRPYSGLWHRAVWSVARPVRPGRTVTAFDSDTPVRWCCASNSSECSSRLFTDKDFVKYMTVQCFGLP